jgi:hypothetical protein
LYECDVKGIVPVDEVDFRGCGGREIRSIDFVDNAPASNWKEIVDGSSYMIKVLQIEYKI